MAFRLKLLVPVKVNAVLFCARIAPPESTELLLKLFVPLKVSTVLLYVKIAPPESTELLLKLFVPLKVLIRESVDSLCRDGADAQYMQYLSKSRTTSPQTR